MGLLDDLYNDPNSMGLLSAGMGMMSAGGPSRMPVSLGQALGQGMQAGMGGYQAAMHAQKAKIDAQLHQAQLNMMPGQLEMQQMQIEAAKMTDQRKKAFEAMLPQMPDEVKQAYLMAGPEKAFEMWNQNRLMAVFDKALNPQPGIQQAPQPRPYQGQTNPSEFRLDTPEQRAQLVSDYEKLQKIDPVQAAQLREGLIQQGVIQPPTQPQVTAQPDWNQVALMSARAQLGGIKGASGMMELAKLNKPDWKVQDMGGQLLPYNANSPTNPLGNMPIAKTLTPGEEQSGKTALGHLALTAATADPMNTMGLRETAAMYGAPSAPSAAPSSTSGATGEEYLSSLPKPMADQIKALAEGRMAFPSGFALKTPYWQNMITAVAQYDPSFDAVNYSGRAKTRASFTSGQDAKNVTAIATGIGHLQTLSTAADKLNNTSFIPYNAVKNAIAGATGDPTIPAFDITRNAVGDELMRIFRQVGASDAEAKAWKETLSRSGSPAQLHAAIAQAGELLESRISSMNETYNRGMGTTADVLQLVSPKSRQALDKMKNYTIDGNKTIVGTGNDGEQKPRTATLADIAATAKASGKSTAEVTRALKAKGYTIGGI